MIYVIKTISAYKIAKTLPVVLVKRYGMTVTFAPYHGWRTMSHASKT